MQSLRGTLAIIAVLALATPAWPQIVRVWDAPLPERLLAADPADVVALLDDADFDADLISTDACLDADALTPESLSLLVIPTIGAYPDDGISILEEYLADGGAILSLGGVPFSRPIVNDGGGWEMTSVPEEPPGEVITIADFDETTPEVGLRGGEGPGFEWEIEPADGGQGLNVSVEDLQQWCYIEMPVADTGDASHSVLHFRARGDANTPIVGIELNETDGSRWKYVVPLTEQWREYTIFIPHFLSYATEDRGGEGDYLHPERLKTLSFGFTRKMVGEGPHAFMLDDIERWQFEPPSRRSVPRDRSAVLATAEAYGGPVKVPPGQQHPLVRLFEDAERFEGETLTRGNSMPGPTEVHYDGWAINVPTGSGPAYGNVIMSRKRMAHVTPLLERQDGGTVAGLVQVHDGDLAGATIFFLAIDRSDIPGASAVLGQVPGLPLDYMMRGTRIVDALPDFVVEDGGVLLNAHVHMAAPVDGANTTLTATTDDDVSEQRTLELAGDEHRSLQMGLPAGHLDPNRFRLALSIDAGDAVGDAMRLETDIRRTLIDLCDFFVAQQDEDGVIAGAGFVDQRAVRALLAMYDHTGKEDYLDAAIRWGDNEIAMQREDGGYRMGYGITDTSEVCYVADGGEIAIGMARLLSYVPEERRDDYLQSLRNYFRYRESFRLENGKIGVGWVFHDRFTQKGGDGVHKVAIRSDRSFGFVTACTLAAASAWQEITDEPRVREMVVHDARWFLDDVAKTTSVSAEAAQWAHFFIDDPDLRADLAQRMKETLVPFALNTSGWWYGSGGRSAITLGALAYYRSQIEPSPEALAGILRGVYRMASPHSPASMYKVMADDDLDSNEWRYLAYGAVSLAEVLEPLSTMEGIDR